MAPELAVAYVVGLIPSAMVTGIQLWFHRKKVRSGEYRQLQNNLKKVGLVWREAHSDFEEYQPEKESTDLKRFEKDILLMGTFFFFLSWLGAIFNTIVLISVHFLAVTHKERKIFASELSASDLPIEKIQTILQECR